MENGFRDQLRSLGLNEGDVVLVHSSMKALGTQKTPDEFIGDMLDVIGPEGTLLVPALTYDNVTAEQPHFSVLKTEPCIGLIPRTFFRREGVERSLHPTHSVCACGKLAEAATGTHHLDETPVGPNSPFMKLAGYGGKLLFIGDVVNCCTMMHGIEEIVNVPYVLQKNTTRYILEDRDENITEKDYYTHGFAGWNQEYQKIKKMMEYPDMKTGIVGRADCFLFDANALFIKAESQYREDNYFFVSRAG